MSALTPAVNAYPSLREVNTISTDSSSIWVCERDCVCLTVCVCVFWSPWLNWYSPLLHIWSQSTNKEFSNLLSVEHSRLAVLIGHRFLSLVYDRWFDLNRWLRRPVTSLAAVASSERGCTFWRLPPQWVQHRCTTRVCSDVHYTRHATRQARDFNRKIF